MIILENDNNSLDSILQDIKSKFQKGVYNFDVTKGNINYWCTDDKDKTVFFQKDQSYATINENNLKTEKFQDILDSIEYQLDNT